MEGAATSVDAEEVDVSSQSPKLTELPDSLFRGGSIVSLNASVNQLSTLPSAIGTCLHLRTLDLSDNKLTALPPEIGGCAMLEEILLFKNQLKTLPASLGDLSLLRVVNCFNNKLTKLPTELGMSCSALEEINVAANKLMLLPEVPAWTGVKVISAYDNRLVRVGSLAHCTNLDELRLYNNNLEALPQLPSAGSSLSLLEVHNNRIAELSDDCFAGCTGTLKRLLLAGNQLSSLPTSLANCSQLQFLQVGGNRITELPQAVDPDGSAGCAWPALETLFLEQNPISVLPPALLECTKLMRLNLTGTSLPESGDEFIAMLTKQVLSHPGASFWGINGRRYMADEARAASFAQSRASFSAKSSAKAAGTSVLASAAAKASDGPAPGWSLLDDDETQGLACDGCGRELSGEELVWIGSDACDYCKACSESRLAAGGEWTTAAKRLSDAQQAATAGNPTPPEEHDVPSRVAVEAAAAEQVIASPVVESVNGTATPDANAVSSPPLLPSEANVATAGQPPFETHGHAPSEEDARRPASTDERKVQLAAKQGPLSWISESSCCGLRKPNGESTDGTGQPGGNAFDMSLLGSWLIAITRSADAQLGRAIGGSRSSASRTFSSGPITPYAGRARTAGVEGPHAKQDWQEAD